MSRSQLFAVQAFTINVGLEQPADAGTLTACRTFHKMEKSMRPALVLRTEAGPSIPSYGRFPRSLTYPRPKGYAWPRKSDDLGEPTGSSLWP